MGSFKVLNRSLDSAVFTVGVLYGFLLPQQLLQINIKGSSTQAVEQPKSHM